MYFLNELLMSLRTLDTRPLQGHYRFDFTCMVFHSPRAISLLPQFGIMSQTIKYFQDDKKGIVNDTAIMVSKKKKLFVEIPSL